MMNCKNPEACKKAIENLIDYLHHEINEPDQKIIKEHLEECRRCCDLFDFEDKFTRLIREKSGKETCPQTLKNSILKLIDPFLCC